MRLRALAAALLLAALAASTAARAQSCTPPLLGADRRGPASDLARSGTTVYLGAGAALVVVEAADLSNPIERGYDNVSGAVRDVTSRGSAAIALVPDALEFVDATDPTQPEVIGTFPIPTGWEVWTFDARDEMVFFVAPDGLHIISFANPAAPLEIGTFALLDAVDVAAGSGRAYVLASSTIRVLDTSNPAAPVEIASVPAPDEAVDRITLAPDGLRLATWGGYYSHHSWGDAAFYDLADPDLPVLRSSLGYYDDDPPSTVALAGTRAYVNHGAGVDILDLSNLAEPVLVGSIPEWASSLVDAADPGFLLVANRSTGLQVWDVEPASAAHRVGQLDTPGETLDGFFVGDFAVTVHERGLRVFDVAQPERPVLSGSWPEPGAASVWFGQEVTRVGSFAYGQVYLPPVYDNAFGIFDLADLAQPTLAGTFGDGWASSPVMVDRDLAILPIGPPAPLLDVSDPALPVEIGELTTPGSYVFDATLNGDRAYAFTSGPAQPIRLWVYDVSEPAAPLERGVTNLTGGGRSAVRGSLLLVSGHTTLATYDVADPVDVQPLGSLALPPTGTGRRISLYGTRAALDPDPPPGWPQVRSAFRWVEVKDPTQPALLAAIPTASIAHHTFVGPGRIGLADGAAGFALYDSCVPFADGFESGDASAWSFAIGVQGESSTPERRDEP